MVASEKSLAFESNILKSKSSHFSIFWGLSDDMNEIPRFKATASVNL